MGAVIPLFPLSHVLLPGMPLPLHIFEQRYRDLLEDISTPPARKCFGIVALTRGSESGSTGETEFADVGTLAEVLEVEPYDDGTSDLLTIGSRRFRIAGLVDGKPYLRAEVSYLDEVDGDLPPSLPGLVRGLSAEHSQLVHRLTGRSDPPDPGVELPTDPAALSYRIAAQLPLVTGDRQLLLEQPSAAERLARSAALLRREIALLRATRTIAVAPRVLQFYVRPN